MLIFIRKFLKLIIRVCLRQNDEIRIGLLKTSVPALNFIHRTPALFETYNALYCCLKIYDSF